MQQHNFRDCPASYAAGHKEEIQNEKGMAKKERENFTHPQARKATEK